MNKKKKLDHHLSRRCRLGGWQAFEYVRDTFSIVFMPAPLLFVLRSIAAKCVSSHDGCLSAALLTVFAQCSNCNLLGIETVEVAPPKAGEVRIKIVATGV